MFFKLRTDYANYLVQCTYSMFCVRNKPLIHWFFNSSFQDHCTFKTSKRFCSEHTCIPGSSSRCLGCWWPPATFSSSLGLWGDGKLTHRDHDILETGNTCSSPWAPSQKPSSNSCALDQEADGINEAKKRVLKILAFFDRTVRIYVVWRHQLWKWRHSKRSRSSLSRPAFRFDQSQTTRDFSGQSENWFDAFRLKWRKQKHITENTWCPLNNFNFSNLEGLSDVCPK